MEDDNQGFDFGDDYWYGDSVYYMSEECIARESERAWEALREWFYSRRGTERKVFK